MQTEIKQSRAQELAESFINGNLSYVKAQIKTKRMLLEVLEIVKNDYNEEASFIRLMKV